MAEETTKETETQEKEKEPRNDLDQLLEEFGGKEARVTLYRIRGTQAVFLETVDGSLLVGDALGGIREMFGGGRFRIQIRKGGQIQKTTTVTIAGRPKPHPEEEVEEEPQPEAAPTPGLETEVERLRRELDEKTEELRQRDTADLIAGLRRELQAIRDDVRRPPEDAEKVNPLELAVSLTSTFTQATQPYLAALLERKPPEPSFDNMIDLFGRMLEAADRARSGNEYAGVIRDVGKPLVETIGKAVEQKAGWGSPLATDGVPMARPNPPGPTWQQVFGPHVETMVKWASLQVDAELRADVVLEELPDPYLDVVGRSVHRDGFLEEFLAAVPQGAPYRDWFARFFGRLREELVTEAELAAERAQEQAQEIRAEEPESEPEENSPPPGGEEEGAAEGVEVGTGSPPEDD